MANPSPSDIQTVARALSDPSRFQIFWHVYQSSAPVGISELTELMGFNHNAIRQHIGHLVEARLLIEETEKRDRPGRPRLLYTAREDALRFLGDSSRSYQRLAKLILKAAESSAEPYKVGLQAAAEALEAGGDQDTDGLTLLLRHLSIEGFEPSHDGNSIVLEVCPFAEVAAEKPLFVCELHRGLIDGYLGSPAELVAKNPHEASCEIRIAG